MNFFIIFFVSDIYDCIKIQNKTFNKKRYLESQREIDRPFFEQVVYIITLIFRDFFYNEFYIKVMNTFVFEFFMNERIENYTNEINDSYFRLLEKNKYNSSLNQSNR